ncbi:GSCOCG00012623001-RA-CDS [Cotesia congregata]|nr:GSCOCG00012623001-RA-CDS [Cotesia congregata]
MSLFLGATFQSREALDAAVNNYQCTTNRNFIYTSTTYVDKRNLLHPVNPELQIYTATVKCIHNGPPKVYKRRVKNPKIGTNCPAFFSLRLAQKYSVLEIHRWNDQHNCDLRVLPLDASPANFTVRRSSSDSNGSSCRSRSSSRRSRSLSPRSSSRHSSSRRSSSYPSSPCRSLSRRSSSLSSVSSIYTSPKFSPLSSSETEKRALDNTYNISLDENGKFSTSTPNSTSTSDLI